MSVQSVTDGLNQCSLTGYETEEKTPLNSHGIKLYFDHTGRRRYVIPNKCGAIIERNGIIAHVFTMPEHRRKGFASGLIALIRHNARKNERIRFDQNLTNDGRKLFLKIG